MSCEDQAITDMPISCMYWPCCSSPDKAVLENVNGFMVCPICHGSYGPIAGENESNIYKYPKVE